MIRRLSRKRKIAFFIMLFCLVLLSGFLIWGLLTDFYIRAGTLYADIVSNPSMLKIEVGEGGRAEVQFTLANNGEKEALFNIYKIEEQGYGRAESFLSQKKQKLPKKPKKEDLIKARLVKEVPWLLVFPDYDVLSKKESKTIKVRVVADDLSFGEYQANLMVIGLDKKESLAIPVYVSVKPAPKLRFSKITVSDDNKNNVAEPGETVSFIVYLKNEGKAEGKDLKLSLSSKDKNVEIKQGSASVASIAPNTELQAGFIVKVSKDANPKIPPSVELQTTDKEGRTWVLSFYLGEKGKFNYPTGLNAEGKK